MVTGRPSNPASASSCPPPPSAKLVHGKFQLTSFPRLSQDLPPVAASFFARSILKKAALCKPPCPHPVPCACQGPLSHLRLCGSLVTPRISSRAALAARGESRLPAGHHPSTGHHCQSGLWREPRTRMAGWGQHQQHDGILVSTQWSQGISLQDFLGVLWFLYCLLWRIQRLFYLFMVQPAGWRGSRGGIISHPDRWNGSDGSQQDGTPTTP